MQTMNGLGLGYMVVAWNPYTGMVETNHSNHFNRFVHDTKWEKGLKKLLEDMEGSSEWEDELATAGSASKLKDAVDAKNAADVIKNYMTQNKLLDLLKAMRATRLRRKILKNLENKNPDELAFEVDTYDGSKENSNFEEILSENAFKEPTGEDKGSSCSTSGGYRLPTMPVRN